jgi:hypothetical protein
MNDDDDNFCCCWVVVGGGWNDCVFECNLLFCEGLSGGKADLESSSQEDDGEMSSSPLSTSLLIVFPSILSLLTVTGVIAFVCYIRRKRKFLYHLVYMYQH